MVLIMAAIITFNIGAKKCKIDAGKFLITFNNVVGVKKTYRNGASRYL